MRPNNKGFRVTLPHNAKTLDLRRLRAHYDAGDMIFHENDARDNAYIIESGEVEISTERMGRKVGLVRLGAGEVFGETALLGAGKRTATAIATADTEVFAISPEILRGRILQVDPLVGLLMSLLVNRYRKWRYVSPDEAARGQELHRDVESFSEPDHADAFMRDLEDRKKTALGELRMAENIAGGIRREEFVPYLQPIVELPGGRIKGFESLIRWRHPAQGLVSPHDFIPVAERTQMVRDLDMLMLRHACTIAPQLQRFGRDVYVSVNLSGVHFDSDTLAQDIAKIVYDSGVNPSLIVLEITESALMGDPAVAEKALGNLRLLGLRVALDDFGTGYSSLGYLHRFPIDILKIDRSFVTSLAANDKSTDVVRAIVSLAQTFQLDLVAEGIESAGDAETLAALGCGGGQGYLYGRPMPFNDAMSLLQK